MSAHDHAGAHVPVTAARQHRAVAEDGERAVLVVTLFRAGDGTVARVVSTRDAERVAEVVTVAGSLEQVIDLVERWWVDWLRHSGG